ncbi:cytochrome P450 [Cubamyces sp. BRFM 1775]|nr:cytochrome P450 [Cubamyces sp. BRFM 1775]
MLDSSFITWQIVAIALFVPFLFQVAINHRRRRLPPGPKGLPLLGSVLELPGASQELRFAEWGKQYGDVVYFKVFRTPTIVLNSLEAVRDVLDKRSSKYSDRPRMTLLVEVMEQTAALVSIPYGNRLRKHRKWLHDGVANKTKLVEYRDVQRREVRRLLQNLLADPKPFRDHLHLYLAAILMEVTYGKQVTSLDDELVHVAELALEAGNDSGSPGSLLVDFFPILKYFPSWLPGGGYKKKAMIGRKHIKDWEELPYNKAIAEMASGIIAPCIFTSVMSNYQGPPPPEDVKEIKGLGFNVYNAGMETSRGTLLMFLFCMTRHPQVLRKAQEEMDRVVGNDRLPDFSDRESLPYLNAVLEEILRWHPALPMAVPHRLMVDDEYRGYDLPAGATVIANTWAITRDARYFPDPEEFRPERYLVSDEEKRGLPLPSSFVFGYGRRVCPGQPLADASVWIAIANIVALFDIRKSVDAAGNEVTPLEEFLPGFTSQLAPFICDIRPRSDKAATMISHLDM